MAKQKLVVFDTTLRDGEQSPGVTLNLNEKLEIAKQLSRLGVDVCEAGFPIASQGDFEAVEAIAKEVGPLTIGRENPMVICALARCVQGDMKRAFDAVKFAPLHRIHIFLATSDIHLKYKLKISREECIQRAVNSVKYVKELGCNDIEFSPEDAGRSEKEFLVKVLGAVVEAGATTLNIPDTVGYNTPQEYGELIDYLVKNVPGAEKITFSTHCHNDLGLATANTLQGILNGARQVEVTINGIGERAGNTSLEEIVMTLYTHPNSYPVHHAIDTFQIYATSQLVTKRTGMVIQPNKAIVGGNAFAHESGIHQDGVLKHKETYEIIRPEVVGIPSNSLVLGKHSGRNAFNSRLNTIINSSSVYDKIILSDSVLMETLFKDFKNLADTKKRGVTDQDLFALLDDQLQTVSSGPAHYTFESCQVVSGSNVKATATVCIIDNSCDPCVKLIDAAIGHGPVHSIFQAISRITKCYTRLANYDVSAVTEGSDSLGKVTVKIIPDMSELSVEVPVNVVLGENISANAYESSRVYVGAGTHEDILVASAKAYLNAVNRYLNAVKHSKKDDAVYESDLMEEENSLKRKDPFDEEQVVLSASAGLSIEENKRLEALWMNNHKKSSRKVEEVPETRESTGKQPKKRIALLLSYAGTGYQGMQLNPGAATIELDLLKALSVSGAVSADNSMDPVKIGFSRSARTDKGVHASGQVVTFKMILQDPDIIEKINAALPPQIRVWGYVRTNKNFNAKTHCDSRFYEYLCPTYIFKPADQERWSSSAFLRREEVNASDLEICKDYRSTPEQIENLKSILKEYLGTHNHHNFTIGKKFDDKSAFRYIMSFECSSPFIRENMEWVSIKVHGQSFMLHQIRKLIGLAILMIKTNTPCTLIPKTFEETKLNIPKAPALGLLLERTVFSGYNTRAEKLGGDSPPITFTPFESPMKEFKEREIYSRIIKEEIQQGIFEDWIRGVEERPYDYFWFLRPDGTLDESIKPQFTTASDQQ